MTMQAPVPVHPPPDHPAKVEFAADDAVRVNGVLSRKSSVQSLGQDTPVGLLAMVPVPVPVSVRVKVWRGISENVAVTEGA